MRLSEKTVEINICAQVVRASKSNLVWFGLTQAQEARAGFDAAIKLGGKLLIFQFKASNYTLKKTGARRFTMEHDQLERLCYQAASCRRSVFYAFPLIGNTHELVAKKGDFLRNTYLLDVSGLPIPYSKPTIKGNSTVLRKNNSHHGDILVSPSLSITIHSEPQTFPLVRLSDLVERGFSGSDGLGLVRNENSAAVYRRLLQLPVDLRRGMKALIIF